MAELEQQVALGASSAHQDGLWPIWKFIWSSDVKMKLATWKIVLWAVATMQCKFLAILWCMPPVLFRGLDDEMSFHVLIVRPNAVKPRDGMKVEWLIPY